VDQGSNDSETKNNRQGKEAYPYGVDAPSRPKKGRNARTKPPIFQKSTKRGYSGWTSAVLLISLYRVGGSFLKKSPQFDWTAHSEERASLQEGFYGPMVCRNHTGITRQLLSAGQGKEDDPIGGPDQAEIYEGD